MTWQSFFLRFTMIFLGDFHLYRLVLDLQSRDLGFFGIALRVYGSSRFLIRFPRTIDHRFRSHMASIESTRNSHWTIRTKTKVTRGLAQSLIY